MNCPKLCVQHKKPLWHIKLSNELASQFKRSQFCFELNTLMIVKVNVIINHSSSFLKGRYLCPVNALCFENREEIFSQSIIIRIATSWHWRRNVVSFSQVEIRLRSVLKPLVTVELQLSSDLFLSLGSSDRIQDKIYVLNSWCFVCDYAAVIKVTYNRKIQKSLRGLYVWYVCYPLLIRSVSVKITVKKIIVSV